MTLLRLSTLIISLINVSKSIKLVHIILQITELYVTFKSLIIILRNITYMTTSYIVNMAGLRIV